MLERFLIHDGAEKRPVFSTPEQRKPSALDSLQIIHGRVDLHGIPADLASSAPVCRKLAFLRPVVDQEPLQHNLPPGMSHCRNS